ncbi:MAG: dihydroorotate dehydrogenase [Candidatus Cloacimonetes bacterium]|nr:dihydroorotate dehydrogenase [Candidatus Cloacimonadota bacterium]
MGGIVNLLATSLGRIDLHSPVTVASGTFDTAYFDLFDQKVLGAYVTKTITLEPKRGNSPPRLYETEAGLLNSIGLQNPGLKAWLNDEFQRLLDLLQIPLIVSFSGASEDEFFRILDGLELQEGIAGYEVNISCPNVAKEGIAFGADPDVVFSLAQALSAITERELAFKLSPNVTDIARIAQAAEAGGASSLALINTLYGSAIDWNTGRFRTHSPICGYSGSGIKPVALALCHKVAQAVKIPILALGGIHNWHDALEFFWAGASAIALGIAFYSDPLAAVKLRDGLETFLRSKGLSLSDLIGQAR